MPESTEVGSPWEWPVVTCSSKLGNLQHLHDELMKLEMQRAGKREMSPFNRGLRNPGADEMNPSIYADTGQTSNAATKMSHANNEEEKMSAAVREDIGFWPVCPSTWEIHTESSCKKWLAWALSKKSFENQSAENRFSLFINEKRADRKKGQAALKKQVAVLTQSSTITPSQNPPTPKKQVLRSKKQEVTLSSAIPTEKERESRQSYRPGHQEII